MITESDIKEPPSFLEDNKEQFDDNEVKIFKTKVETPKPRPLHLKKGNSHEYTDKDPNIMGALTQSYSKSKSLSKKLKCGKNNL